MRRTGVAALLGTVCAGVVALVLVAASDDRELAFTLGVVPATVAAEVGPGETVCQSPITASVGFARVRFQAASPGGAARSLEVSVLDAASRARLGAGRVGRVPAEPAEVTAEVGAVAGGRRIAVCVENEGPRRVALYGNTAGAVLTSQASDDERPLETDLTLVFLRPESRSMLALLPDMFERAALFRPGWVGPGVFWLLAAGLVLAVPVLLARALADAAEGATAAPQARPPERAGAP
jgi:hypothetical protein